MNASIVVAGCTRAEVDIALAAARAWARIF